MEISNLFYIEVLQVLAQSNVQYVLVGGLAVSYHGYSRYTGDMDLWIKPDVANMHHLYAALLQLGYSESMVNHIRQTRNLDHPTPIKLQDDSNQLKIDLMTYIFQSKVSWQECYDHADIMTLGEIKVPVVDIDHLITLKENTSRLDSSMKDLVDAQELKKNKRSKTKTDWLFRARKTILTTEDDIATISKAKGRLIAISNPECPISNTTVRYRTQLFPLPYV